MLSFLAQLNLCELPDGTGLLPDKGWLFFFYDVDQQQWGFDPRNRGCSRVFYFDGDANALRRTDPPPDVKQFEFAATKLTPSLTATLPRWRYQLDFDLDESAHEAYWELAESQIAGKEPHHRLLGWPKQVQGEMDLECQLVTNGIYCGGPEAYTSEEAQRLQSGASDWIMVIKPFTCRYDFSAATVSSETGISRSLPDFGVPIFPFTAFSRAVILPATRSMPSEARC